MSGDLLSKHSAVNQSLNDFAAVMITLAKHCASAECETHRSEHTECDECDRLHTLCFEKRIEVLKFIDSHYKSTNH